MAMTTSCTDTKHPYYKDITKIDLGKRRKFFTGDNSFRMAYVSLGEALDFLSAGGMNYVYWPISHKGLIEFVDNWMKNQKPKIDYKKVPLSEHSYRYEEIRREHFYLWNRFDDEQVVELPWINHEKCPRDEKHNGQRITLPNGMVRCSHVEPLGPFKPSFLESYTGFDELSGIERTYFDENEPHQYDGIPQDYDERDISLGYKEEYERNTFLVQKFEEEDSTLVVTDPCYAIISEGRAYLPLETVLDRLDVASRFLSSDEPQSVYPFSGFTLADFVRAWWNQSGEKRFFRNPNERNFYKVFRDFQPISSDD